jgi:hypothetical protein
VDRRRFIRSSAALVAGLAARNHVLDAFTSTAQAHAETHRRPYRAFSDDSEWNRPLPPDAPVDPSSRQFVSHLKDFDPDLPFPSLADGPWSEPIYWAGADDPEYELPDFDFRVRIPADAEPAPTNDSQLIVYDRPRGYVIKLQKASFTGTTWSARWTAIYYLDSNGLFGELPASDDPRNRGHRGFPPPLHAVRWDEVQAEAIRHVLKVAIRETAPRHVYPGAGHESGSGMIPEGAVFRIKPSVDLRARGLRGPALAIARAMKRYGIVVGDQSGVPMALKLENLRAEGRRVRWSDIGIEADSLSRLSFSDLECIELGYRRP